MEPPSPPSPPSGPPLGMNFSRRKLRQPLPPLPASTVMVASSTNFIITSNFHSSRDRKKILPQSGRGSRALAHDRLQTKKAPPGRSFSMRVSDHCSGRNDAHVFTVVRTLGLELDHAVCSRKQSVILAQTNVGAGVEFGATLTDQNVTCDNGLTTETLYAQTL